jgi:hypothetical protein
VVLPRCPTGRLVIKKFVRDVYWPTLLAASAWYAGVMAAASKALDAAVAMREGFASQWRPIIRDHLVGNGR